MEKITSRNSERVSRNENANKTTVLFRRINFVFVEGLC